MAFCQRIAATPTINRPPRANLPGEDCRAVFEGPYSFVELFDVLASRVDNPHVSMVAALKLDPAVEAAL